MSDHGPKGGADMPPARMIAHRSAAGGPSMNVPRIRPWLALIPVLGMASCVVVSRPLSPVVDVHATLGSVEHCAKSRGLEAVRHPDSVNVRVESTWVQFMARAHKRIDMVIVMADDAPPDERAERERSA